MLDIPNRRKPIETETNEQGCMLITSHCTAKSGHIQMKIGGKVKWLHRYIYEQTHGELSEELVVRHKCDNPNCVNIEHLELGTHEDNVRDRVERSRSATGTNNGRAKLTEDDIIYIRTCEGITKAELARKFNVDRKVIRNILEYKTWKHVKISKECNTSA